MALEQRISRLEGAYEQVDKRLDDLSRAIEGLRTDMKLLERRQPSLAQFRLLDCHLIFDYQRVSNGSEGLFNNVNKDVK